jgi:uncharacterized protein
MNIQQADDKKRGFLFVEQDGERLAEMVYKYSSPNIIVIEHTEVDDLLRGKNVGYQLIHRIVEFARTEHLKIIPVCPFAKSVFEKDHSLSDVLYKA